MDKYQTYLDAFSARHACKEFDSTKKISEQDFAFILEVARLSPTSFGLEPWKLLVIQNPAQREKLLPFTWGGQKQIPTASHLLIAVSRMTPDMRYDSDYIDEKLFKRRQLPADIEKVMRQSMANFQKEDIDLLSNDRHITDWASKQSYIILANMMNAAALIGIDSCPMEGFNMAAMREFLAEECQLDTSRFNPCYLVGFGYRKQEPRAKIRSTMDELVAWHE